MSEPLTWLLASAAGLLLGAIFFGGLWWTIRKGVGAPQPVFWFFGSFVLRMGVVLSGFYLVADGQWQRLLASLAGFLLARLVVLRLLAGAPHRPPWRGREAGDAP